MMAFATWLRLWVDNGANLRLKIGTIFSNVPLYGSIQKQDETNDSYLNRHDIAFEDLVDQEGAD